VTRPLESALDGDKGGNNADEETSDVPFEEDVVIFTEGRNEPTA
jgi:hypothetical protein